MPLVSARFRSLSAAADNRGRGKIDIVRGLGLALMSLYPSYKQWTVIRQVLKSCHKARGY